MKIKIKKIDELMKALKRQKTAAIGLDIGSDSIKLVELVQSDAGIKLNKIDSVNIQRASGDTIGQNQIIKKVIAALLDKNQIKTKDVTLGINAQFAFIKFLTILPVSLEKLNKTLKYEAQQQIPFSLDEVEWDTHLLEAHPKEKFSPQRVLLVAVKKNKLAGKRILAEENNLSPGILDVNILSIYNCLKFNQNYDENKLTLVLDIGTRATDLLILKDNEFWIRSMAIGGDNLTEAIRSKFNKSFAEAERIKQKDADNPEVAGAIRPVLENLRGEIVRSIEYYHFQKNQDEAKAGEKDAAPQAGRVEEVLLSGGGALTPGLDKFLTESFSCGVKQLEPFRMLILDEEMEKRLSGWNKLQFAQAVGLALRGLSKSYVKINLLKEQIRKKKLVQQRLVYGVGSLVMALLIILGVSTFMSRDYRDKNSRLQHFKGLLNTFNTHQPQIKELEGKEYLLSRQVSILGELGGNRALWLKVLAELQKMLPDNLWITEYIGTISFDNSADEFVGKLDLQGMAGSYGDVNILISKLKAASLFTEVKPLSSTFVEEQTKDKKKKEVVKFSISIKLKL
jgi:type IV pilus assembly protein PilM